MEILMEKLSHMWYYERYQNDDFNSWFIWSLPEVLCYWVSRSLCSLAALVYTLLELSLVWLHGVVLLLLSCLLCHPKLQISMEYWRPFFVVFFCNFGYALCTPEGKYTPCCFVLNLFNFDTVFSSVGENRSLKIK